MKFKANMARRRFGTKTDIAVISAIVIAVLIGGVFLIRKSYSENLKPVNSNSEASHVVTVEPGSSPAEIADLLKSKGAIRSDWAFEWYIRNHQLGSQLKAGTYIIYEKHTVEEIINTLVEGRVASDLVTILPGKRLDQIRKGLISDGFTAAEVDAALAPAQYEGHPALTDKPAGANLEGYLYPESFQKTSQTNPKQIIKLSLDEMQRRLTPQLREAISKQGLTLHQAVTIASIIEQEVSNPSDRAQVAQVFLKRYRSDIPLGSDPTAAYGAVLDGKEPSVKYDSPYNTRIHKGLTPGPIGNVSEGSLQAVAYPAQTDWLYFVSGDDGTTHFSKTLEEHEGLTQKYCTKLCGN